MKTFIIAELSANHLQQYEIAERSIKAMAESGADAVKCQTYTANTMTLNSKNECFTINNGSMWDGQTYHSLYDKAGMPWNWQPKLKEYAESLGLVWFSTPFDKTSVDFLESINNPIYKIASFELVDIPLIEYAASKGKPMIMSTGIATIDEIKEAVDACKRVNNYNITLLKCTSAYPTPYEELNLKAIPYLKELLCVPIGLSDHTLSSAVAVSAVTLGATTIEKHFILDRSMGGPDAEFSMEPHEFKYMVESIRKIEAALSTEAYKLPDDIDKKRMFMRSIFVVKDIKKGELLTEDNIRSIRPNNGLEPKHFNQIIGTKAKYDIKKGTPLQIEHLKIKIDGKEKINRS